MTIRGGEKESKGIGFQSPSNDPLPICPSCQSTRIFKDGLRIAKEGKIQRYVCRDCGYRFSGSSKLVSPVLSERGHIQECINKFGLGFIDSDDRCNLNDQVKVDSQFCGPMREEYKKSTGYETIRRVCADEAKNLVAAIEINRAAGDISTGNEKELIFNFAWWMKKQGLAEDTIDSKTKILRILAKRGFNLHDPESVKDGIARQKWSAGRKENAVHAYTTLLRMQEKTWTPPRYRRIDKDPWIPTETEVDQLIAGSSPKVSTFLQLLKETGMRPGEAWSLKWTDINIENSTVSITPEKGSNSRTLKLSSRLLSMINKFEKRNIFVFNNGLLDHFSQNFRQQRKAVAFKLNNPRILQITFKTLRHFKATMEYHKTKDILHVKYLLGHRRIENTLIYTHLVDFGNDEYLSKVAKNAAEACQLVELGYDFVCNTSDGLSIFRKRK